MITAAAGFPTTVNPIFQCGLTPVFVDIDLGTYNVNPKVVEQAITDKTTKPYSWHIPLGNPYDAEYIAEIALQNGLWLIEDCCDALGSTFSDQNVGTFGSLSIYSFYPAHHITMGEGGAILTNDTTLNKEVNFFRDWEGTASAPPGSTIPAVNGLVSNSAHCRLGMTTNTYTQTSATTLKALDLQPAIGMAQLEKLDEFIEKRRLNYNFLMETQWSIYQLGFIIVGAEAAIAAALFTLTLFGLMKKKKWAPFLAIALTIIQRSFATYVFFPSTAILVTTIWSLLIIYFAYRDIKYN